MFAPVAGVMVFDYLFVGRLQISLGALFDPKGAYRYWNGFNLVAVAWTAIGFAICTFAVPAAWIPSLVTLFVSGTGYVLTTRLLSSRRAVASSAAMMSIGDITRGSKHGGSIARRGDRLRLLRPEPPPFL